MVAPAPPLSEAGGLGAASPLDEPGVPDGEAGGGGAAVVDGGAAVVDGGTGGRACKSADAEIPG